MSGQLCPDPILQLVKKSQVWSLLRAPSFYPMNSILLPRFSPCSFLSSHFQQHVEGLAPTPTTHLDFSYTWLTHSGVWETWPSSCRNTSGSHLSFLFFQTVTNFPLLSMMVVVCMMVGACKSATHKVYRKFMFSSMLKFIFFYLYKYSGWFIIFDAKKGKKGIQKRLLFIYSRKG
jgi:hypothetical protein